MKERLYSWYSTLGGIEERLYCWYSKLGGMKERPSQFVNISAPKMSLLQQQLNQREARHEIIGNFVPITGPGWPREGITEGAERAL